jgi:osmoprotectant transport system permease protein
VSRRALAALGLMALATAGCGDDAIVIGSKKFTESVVLGEIAVQVAAGHGAELRHVRELGGTRILWDALRAGEIDVYPEYTGTLREEILVGRAVASDAELAAALAAEGVTIVAELGFDDTYAIGMREEEAARLGIRTLSDLARHPEVALGLSHEFLDREDGWPSLRARYGLAPTEVRGLVHDVAYRALVDGAIGATDVYTTDPEIRRYRLRTLEDDRRHFPAYRAVLLARADLARRAPGVARALAGLAGRIDRERMLDLNARVAIDRVPERAVAAGFVAGELGGSAAAGAEPDRLGRVLDRTREHLALVALSLVAAIVVAVPLGVIAARRPLLGQLLLGAVGVLQTVPSLALLVLLIPLLGIGTAPALAAMFLYGLLPILRNTATGLGDLAPPLRESGEALGLTRWALLVRVELPLASPAILAGVQTSAVLAVGTATLGALIGAGGYGQPILTGIRLGDVGWILEGAVPAALLALVVQGGFELLARLVVPRGLRLRKAR